MLDEMFDIDHYNNKLKYLRLCKRVKYYAVDNDKFTIILNQRI
jgi:hypothetical protein